MKALALILAWRILNFHMPTHHVAPSCAQGTDLPPYYQFKVIEVEAAHDSLHWIWQCRWGAVGVPPGGAFRIIDYPDSAFEFWHIRAVNWADSASCWSAAVHK